jgi:hypothetical protein
MSKQSVQYHYLTCDGVTGNILVPACPAVSAGGTDEQEVSTRASSHGWTITDRKSYCPQHTPPKVLNPVRKPKVSDGQQQD